VCDDDSVVHVQVSVFTCVCVMMIMWYMCRYQYLPLCSMMIVWYTCRYQYLPVCDNDNVLHMQDCRYQYLPVCDDDSVVHVQESVFTCVCVMMIMWYTCRYQYLLVFERSREK